MRHSKIQKSENGAEFYKCMKCPKTCKTTSGMSRHYKTNHPITPGEYIETKEEQNEACETSAGAN